MLDNAMPSFPFERHMQSYMFNSIWYFPKSSKSFVGEMCPFHCCIIFHDDDTKIYLAPYSSGWTFNFPLSLTPHIHLVINAWKPNILCICPLSFHPSPGHYHLCCFLTIAPFLSLYIFPYTVVYHGMPATSTALILTRIEHFTWRKKRNA